MFLHRRFFMPEFKSGEEVYCITPLLKRLFLYPKINSKGCIHAVQMDSNINFFIKNSLFTISIHAASVGSDKMISNTCPAHILVFQSTQPMRAATAACCFQASVLASISIHAAHKGCDCGQRDNATGNTGAISIHAARMDSDPQRYLRQNFGNLFQSTLPMRAATRRLFFFCFRFQISIHAAHEGCDQLSQRIAGADRYFNPRCPSGQRHDA